MKTWFSALSPREKTLVLFATTAAFLLLFWLFLVKPLYDNHTRLNKIIAKQESTLQIMKKQSVKIKQLQRQNKNPVTTNNKNPQQLIEQALLTWRLKPSLERMQSQGANGVRIVLKNTNADRVMRFLYELEEKYALSISDMAISNTKEKLGFADVRLTIKKLNR